jgi:NADPH:quinone reductase-like Zn-dependent oxidoreductase
VLGALPQPPEANQQLIQIGGLIETGQIRPIIDTVLPLSQARQSYEQGARGHTRGKTVLRVVDESAQEARSPLERSC